MVIVGADIHKRTHTFVAVDDNGRKLGEKTVDTTSTGHSKALNWVRLHFGVDVVWGIEDVRQFSGRLERDLLAAGQRVVRVPPNLTARSRAVSRSPGKSDPIDARAILREPDLPMACHDEVSLEVKLLVDRREDLVAQRTSTVNRLSTRVHELDPSRAAKPLMRDRVQFCSGGGSAWSGSPQCFSARAQFVSVQQVQERAPTRPRQTRTSMRWPRTTPCLAWTFGRT